MVVIVDSSVWIDILSGRRVLALQETAAEEEGVVLPPLVIAELLSGDLTPLQRETIGELLQDFPLHRTDLGHWMRVGELRRLLRINGVNATIPDVHVAQCALDRDATLITRDDIFVRIARHTSLRVSQLR